MTEQVTNPIGDQKINFTFTVNQVNSILAVLGNAPFVQSANLINEIQQQGAPQVKELEDAAPKAE